MLTFCLILAHFGVYLSGEKAVKPLNSKPFGFIQQALIKDSQIALTWYVYNDQTSTVILRLLGFGKGLFLA